ncbi:Serine protease snake [Orchesella cincta]|uniref:Serine protease snake n=1 Tax=Orchesella cincta TaxID=48709 RepID=A0A1D2N741_ORCCI|nr:Serine protease snake [Orchesella cincta]
MQTFRQIVGKKFGPPTKLLLGDITLSKRTSNTREMSGVARVFVHPNYKPPQTYHDIAIIQMSRKIRLSKSIMPACLPQAEDDLLKKVSSKNFTASGYGITGVGEAQSDTLQVVNLSGYAWDTCNAFYREIPTWNIKFPDGITRTQICAGDAIGRKDTCQGDSGGPLLLPDKTKRCIFNVVGITSFGPNQCGEKAPAIYTNVLSYLDWIESIVWPAKRQ